MSTVTHTGEWAGAVPYSGQDPVLDTWVVETAGEHTISWVLESPDDLVHARVVTPDGTATGDLAGYGTPSTATLTVTLNEGDIIEFQHVINTSGRGGSGTGSWSITAPATLPPLPENAHYASSIVGVYHGGTLARALYLGDRLVWEAGGGWPATGQFGPQTVTGYDLEVGRFTIDEAGTYEIEMTAEAGGNGIAIYIYVDGTRVAGKNLGNPRQVTATRSVSAGAVVTFTMSPIVPPPQHSDGGTWSITPA